MSDLQAYLGRFELPTTAVDLTVELSAGGGAQAVALTVAEYFMAGYTAEGTENLVEHLETQIKTVDSAATVVLNLDGANAGKVTITLTDDTQIVWVDSDLRDILGFSQGDITSTSTGSDEARFVWLPSLDMSERPTNKTEFWEFTSTSKVDHAPDGTPHGRAGKSTLTADIKYDLLDDLEVLIPAGAGVGTNKTFEKLFRTSIHETRPIRILPDRASYTSTSFLTGLFANSDAEEIGGLRDWIDPSYGEQNHTEWDVALFFVKYAGVGA